MRPRGAQEIRTGGLQGLLCYTNYIILDYILFYSILVYCIILYYIRLYPIISDYIVLCYIRLYDIVLQFERPESERHKGGVHGIRAPVRVMKADGESFRAGCGCVFVEAAGMSTYVYIYICMSYSCVHSPPCKALLTDTRSLRSQSN